MAISKDTLIADILKETPGSKDIFEKFNMGCISCLGIQSETLEKGCMMHGLDVNEVLKELKKLGKNN
jgi:hybrid cluster-associated redox disulfide protein